MTRIASFAVLVAIIAALGFVFYLVMSDFIVPLFIAALLVVIFRPLHKWVSAKCGERPRIAAAITSVAILVIVLLPAVLVLTMAIAEATNLARSLNTAEIRHRLTHFRTQFGLQDENAESVRDLQETLAELRHNTRDSDYDDKLALGRLVSDLKEITSRLEEDPDRERKEKLILDFHQAIEAQLELANGSLEHENGLRTLNAKQRQLEGALFGGPVRTTVILFANPSDDELEAWQTRVIDTGKDWLISITGPTTAYVGKTILGFVIVGISLYFFLADGPAMTQSLMHLSPLDDRYEQELITEFNKVSRAVVLATLLAAVTQGLLAGIGFWMAGMDSVFLLILLTTVFAMVPFFGAGAIWIPVCLHLFFYEERTTVAILLAIYSGGIVSTADNVIKPLVLHGQSNLHPLIALLSILGGVKTLGPIGILVGPMVAAFLQTLLKILQRELAHFEASPSFAHLGLVGAPDKEPSQDQTVERSTRPDFEDDPPQDEADEAEEDSQES